MARAVYSGKDLILLDDPMSALDGNVKRQIFEKVIMGVLKNKTRVLVTHAMDFLHLCDKIIVMKEGEIFLEGSLTDLANDPYVMKLMEIHKSN